MTTEIPLTVAVDNSDGLARIRPRRRGRRRTINLLFEVAPVGFQVRAWGSALPDDGDGAYAGRLTRPRDDVNADVQELRSTWSERFVGVQLPADRGGQRYPFADTVDLTAADLVDARDTATRALARAGHRLFRTLFYDGDIGLRDIGDVVAAALRASPQVISVHSDELFVPWAMLYVPPDPSTDLDDDAAACGIDGFLGYRHLVEHNFSRAPGWETGLAVADRVHAGVNVNRNLDTRFPKTPTVEPIVRMFREHAEVTVRESRAHLARDLTAADFRDQILYFGCHGQVAEDGGPGAAHIALTDGLPIYPSDFRDWLLDRQLRTNPIVYVNACQGGQVWSPFHPSLSRALLSYGANCLLGPQIDIPPAFAGWYAAEFLSRVLRLDARVGDVVRDLTALLADRYANPLGLVMSTYRGMDTHFYAANGTDLNRPGGRPPGHSPTTG